VDAGQASTYSIPHRNSCNTADLYTQPRLKAHTERRGVFFHCPCFLEMHKFLLVTFVFRHCSASLALPDFKRLLCIECFSPQTPRASYSVARLRPSCYSSNRQEPMTNKLRVCDCSCYDCLRQMEIDSHRDIANSVSAYIAAQMIARHGTAR